ncbi:hypothetical protein [Flavobacterium frigidarium]|uniref:hypothetical protein n=1 Tax=Flavobacterium frigidarium TaxID=99286 RepID=UPI0003F871CC|nr:hypothetical protein [Flavobacterium frigidarium]
MIDLITISEVAHTGEVHFQVNSCFVEMFSLSFPNTQIKFNGEKKHIKAVQESLLNSNLSHVEFLSFEGFYDENEFNWAGRIFGECRQIIKILKRGKLDGSKLYVWTCLFPTGHLFLNFIQLFQNENNHIIILHGELEYLKVKNKRLSEIIFGFILRVAINLSTKRTKYIVLGENIKKNLTPKIGQRILKRTYSFLHPYNFYTAENSIKTKDGNIITIGAIGTQMLSKNSNYIYALASWFKKDILKNKINFVTIGKVLPELHQYDSNLVKKLYPNSFVSQREFEREILKLDFIVFFYDNKAYELCASGAIFEAIRLGVPIISIKNDYFNWLFDSYGSMGFLCETMDELQIIITKLISGEHKEEIANFNYNMARFKVNNNLKNLAVNLKNII